jgi:hypothetical protein
VLTVPPDGNLRQRQKSAFTEAGIQSC